jgi:sortase B
MASYNHRPRSKNKYKDGKKRNPLVRFLMWIFPCKGDGAFESVRKVIFLGAFGCFVFFGGKILIDVTNEWHQSGMQRRDTRGVFDILMGDREIPRDVYENVRRLRPDILPEYVYHFNQNNDLVGHIYIPDITLNLPYNDLNRYILNYLVYQTDDNDYYLERTPQHTFSKGGSIFADYRNNFTDGELSGNTVLYGHNIYSGNYFTPLTRYYQRAVYNSDLAFYQKHPLILFNSLYEKMEWKVFAVGLYNTSTRHGEVFDYIFPEFRDEAAFNEFILGVMDRSVIFTDVDLQYGDHILTLSTCYYPFSTLTQTIDSTRVAVFARRVREGESSYVDTSKATVNHNILPFTLQEQRVGSNWRGRVWDTSYLLSYDGG